MHKSIRRLRMADTDVSVYRRGGQWRRNLSLSDMNFRSYPLSFLTPAKKSLVAVALVAPLALTACNSDGEDTVSDASSAVKTMTTTKASDETSAPSKSEDKKEEDKDKSEENKDGEDKEPKQEGEQPQAEGEAPESVTNPFENGGDPFKDMPKAEPVQGEAASQEDVDGINNLVRGLYDTTTMRQFIKYLPDHACAEVRNNPESGLNNIDYNQVPDIPINQLRDMVAASGQGDAGMENFNWDQTGVESINDVVVNGDDASATVNVNTNKGVDSSTMRFKRENGNWTFCG